MSFRSDMEEMAAEFFAGDMFADATLTRRGGAAAVASFNPITGTVTSGGTAGTVVVCKAATSTVETKAQDGALVTSTRLTLSVEPIEGDTLTIGAATYELGAISTESVTGFPIVWMAVAK